MSAAAPRRACARGKEDEARPRRRAASAGAARAGLAPPVVHAVLAGPGAALDARARPVAERVLGAADFGRVRVHADARAAESAAAVGALAYTVGRHVVFAAGRYAPGTAAGDRLLAHELAHVAQQRGAAAAAVPAALPIGDAGGAFEAEAERVAAGGAAAPAFLAPPAPAPAMPQRAGCEGRTYRNCAGAPCTADSGRRGVCQWGGTTYGCRCRDQSGDAPGPSRAMELLPSWLLAMLSAAAVALIVACFASGVCEAGALVAACGAAAAAAVIGILRAAGVTVTEGEGGATA